MTFNILLLISYQATNIFGLFAAEAHLKWWWWCVQSYRLTTSTNSLCVIKYLAGICAQICERTLLCVYCCVILMCVLNAWVVYMHVHACKGVVNSKQTSIRHFEIKSCSRVERSVNMSTWGWEIFQQFTLSINVHSAKQLRWECMQTARADAFHHGKY